jgi:formylglycine-generating enzyme required for sulfatase activity
LVLEPLPIETTASVVKESVEAWSKHLNLPIDRRNSIGLDLTLVPPTSVHLPPDRILQDERLLLPEGTKVLNENSSESFLSVFSSPETKPIVSYPFVISRDAITMAQFQQFVAQTGYVTDAERGEPLTEGKSPTKTPVPAESTQAAGSDAPVEQAAATNPPIVGNIGGWLREDGKSVLPTAAGWYRPDGKFILHDGLNWKTPVPNSTDGSTLPTLPDSPLPVVMLSHNDATAFCQWLSTKENRQYRLPTAHEWTAALQLGAVHLPADAEHSDLKEKRTWFDASQPNALGIRIATEIAGEWTSNEQRANGEEVIVIVKKDISSDGKRFDLSHQWLAPPTFRSSEISFRVVAELQTLTTPVDPPKQ